MHTHQIFNIGFFKCLSFTESYYFTWVLLKKMFLQNCSILKEVHEKNNGKTGFKQINYSLHGIEWTGGTIAIFYTVLFKDIAGSLKICFFFILENLFCEAICDLLKFGTVYFPKQRYFFYLADPSGIWKFLSISFMQI